jgi:hypothetical protein
MVWPGERQVIFREETRFHILFWWRREMRINTHFTDHMMRGLILFLIPIAMSLLAMIGCTTRPTQAQTTLGIADQASAADILQSTVTIRIVAPHLDEHGRRLSVNENGRELPLNAISTGLGTIVTSGEGTLIITSDHFDQLDAPTADITIAGFNGQSVMLSLAAFQSLVRYQNNDVIILTAPPGLPTGVAPGDGDQVQPGTEVQVVRWHQVTNELSVVAATVEAWIDYQGNPSFQLRNLNGELIEPGNSGGGVWFQGRPVGSIHRTILVDDSGKGLGSLATPGYPSHLSYATRLSPVRMSLLNQGLPIAEFID